MKIKSILQGIIIAIFLFACGIIFGENPIIKNGREQKSVTIESDISMSVELEYKGDPLSNDGPINYTIQDMQYQQNAFSVRYPQIVFFKSNEKSQPINSLMKDAAMSWISSLDSIEMHGKVDFQIQYQSPKLISILYQCFFMKDSAAHPYNQIYSLNINLESGLPVKVLDIYAINEKFVQTIICEKNLLHFVGEGDSTTISKQEMFDAVNNSVIHGEDFYLDEMYLADCVFPSPESFLYTYFTNETFGLIVPVAFALGSNVQFEVPYSELECFLQE